MSTMKRHYRPDVPINLTSEEFEEKSNNSAKDEEETEKIQVKVVRKSNSKREYEEGNRLFFLVNEEDHEEGVFKFKIEIDLPIRWVMIWYCQELGLDYQTTRFEFNGAKLREMDTPHQLGMLHHDVIFAFPIHNLGESRHYVTPCIRMHKETDKFLRIKRSTAILPQLMRCFPNSRSLWFVYNGLKLGENHTADELNMEDGDIIDGFDFKAKRSSLSTIWPSGPRLNVFVKCVSGNTTTFIVTPKTRLGQIMDRLVPPNTEKRDSYYRFIYSGRQVSATSTVEEEGLKDGSTLYAVHVSKVVKTWFDQLHT